MASRMKFYDWPRLYHMPLWWAEIMKKQFNQKKEYVYMYGGMLFLEEGSGKAC